MASKPHKSRCDKTLEGLSELDLAGGAAALATKASSPRAVAPEGEAVTASKSCQGPETADVVAGTPPPLVHPGGTVVEPGTPQGVNPQRALLMAQAHANNVQSVMAQQAAHKARHATIKQQLMQQR